MRRGLLLSTVLIVATGLAGYIAYGLPGSAAAATCDPTSYQLHGLPGNQNRGDVPVIFVHGITSSYKTWTKPELNGGDPISQRIASSAGTSVWGFDYGPESADWVTNPAIGPTLAKAITCLARITGKRVILIDHSMGGLATQFAAGQRDGNGTVADHIAEVITLGTPYKGSKLLTAARIAIKGGEDLADPDVAAGTEALLSACAGISQAGLAADNPCGVLAVARTPIGTALEYDSPQIAALPAWPAHLAVNDIAGNIDYTLKLGFIHHTFDFGDIAVSDDSATAHNTDGSPENVTCPHDSLGTIVKLGSACYHSNLPKNPKVVDYVVSLVSRLVARQQPPPSTPTTTTAPPATLGSSSSCGDWYAASFAQRSAYAGTVSPGVQLTTPVPAGSRHAPFMYGFIGGGCDRAKSRGLSPAAVPLSAVLAGDYLPGSTTTPTTTTTAPASAPSTPSPQALSVGAPFDSECVVAWPTAPVRTSDSIQMTMSCSQVPENEYLFAQVVYGDPNLPVTPDHSRVHVIGKIVDIATSAYGYKELVVDASSVQLQ
jgi:pimeloyl-ACP methyl ester carboxylesterase